MTLLFKLALRNRKHYLLLLFSMIAMVFLTAISQLEFVALGVIADKGVGFFELFESEKDKNGLPQVKKQVLIDTYDKIDKDRDGYINLRDVRKYHDTHGSTNWIGTVRSAIVRKFNVYDNIIGFGFFLLLVGLFKGVFLFLNRFLTKVIAIKVSRDLRAQYFSHIQKLPLSFYHKFNVGSLSSRVSLDAFMIAEAINSALINYFQTPFLVLSCLVLCFISNWKLSLIVFIGFPSIIYPVVYLARKMKKVTRQIQKNNESFTMMLYEFLSAIMTIKTYRMESLVYKKYQEQNNMLARYNVKSSFYDVISRPLLHFVAQVLLVSALFYGLYVQGEKLLDLVVFCGLLFLMYEPIKKFAEENMQMQRGVAAAERMFEVLNIPPPVDQDQDSESVTFEDSIEFHKVGFSYEDKEILKEVSFTIKKGEKVGICGPTGAGKSTITYLLPRLYEINSGDIHIDGRSIHSYSKKSLRDAIAYVPQSPFLFIDTVKNNITCGMDITDEKVKEACVKAHAHEFIEKLENQYETSLSELGKNLSGGQKQRLAIARALLKKAQVLIFDEATSNLDAVSESCIQDTLHDLKGSITQIIIAHRLSTIEDADRIIYMDEGRCIAQGSHEQLLKICPQYKDMWLAFTNAKS